MISHITVYELKSLVPQSDEKVENLMNLRNVIQGIFTQNSSDCIRQLST